MLLKKMSNCFFFTFLFLEEMFDEKYKCTNQWGCSNSAIISHDGDSASLLPSNQFGMKDSMYGYYICD